MGSHLPNLSRLELWPASQVTTTTDGNADGKKPAKAAQPSHAEFPYDLITTVLTTLRNDDVEGACRAAARPPSSLPPRTESPGQPKGRTGRLDRG